MENLADKKIIIVGLAREGLAAYRFLRAKFPDSKVAVADQATEDNLILRVPSEINQSTKRYFGPDYLSAIKDYDVVVKSAGVPLKVIRSYVGNAKVTSPTQLFFDNCPGQIIGITGTKGKSTTASVIYEILKACGKKVILCGNIGVPALDLLSDIDKETLVVMEFSSHQLQTVTKSPYIAVLQNIVPEHLDYYENFDDYVAAKANITKFQSESDYLLFNAAFAIPTKIALQSKAQQFPFNLPTDKTGCYSQDGVILYCMNGNEEEILEESGITLLGKHNIQNVMPAVIIGKLFDLPTDAIASAISHFKGLTDRMEFVGTVDGVAFYNDSLSTVPDSAIAAIDALDDNVQTILLGGFDRGLDFTELGRKIIESQVENVILFPTTGQKIWDAIAKESSIKGQEIRLKHFSVELMVEAVEIAKEQTDKGRAVLLSPASPSFGVFKDYHDRGDQFKKAVLSQ